MAGICFLYYLVPFEILFILSILLKFTQFRHLFQVLFEQSQNSFVFVGPA